MQPRHSRETVTPVLPRVVYFIVESLAAIGCVPQSPAGFRQEVHMSSVPPQGPGAVPPPPPPIPPPAVSGGLPWETQALGPQPFFDTAMLFIKAPLEAWRLTRETGDYMRPLLFGVIVGWVGLVFRAVWGTMFGASIMRMVPMQYARYTRFGGGSLIVQVILGPLAIAIGLFVG